jgi:hypothetical protein
VESKAFSFIRCCAAVGSSINGTTEIFSDGDLTSCRTDRVDEKHLRAIRRSPKRRRRCLDGVVVLVASMLCCTVSIEIRPTEAELSRSASEVVSYRTI